MVIDSLESDLAIVVAIPDRELRRILVVAEVVGMEFVHSCCMVLVVVITFLLKLN